MQTNIFIPKRINIGYQNRYDTYTKKLAYVIYYDEKGKLRKEKSWNSWRDERIAPQEFDNVPTTGFVLNKKVGDYSSGWEHRQAYVRIYDPRNFEFEITIENLLYILENTNSIKGKGLEGDFVYGWDGKDLILIPTESPDYVQISEYNKIVHNNESIKAKDLIVGATYLTKQNEEWIYVGRYDQYISGYQWLDGEETHISKNYSDIPYIFGYSGYEKRVEYQNIQLNDKKYYWFAHKSYNYHWTEGERIQESTYQWTFDQFKSISANKFIKCVDDKCTVDYAEIYDKLESKCNFSPIDNAKTIMTPYTLEEFLLDTKDIKNNYYGVHYYDTAKNPYTIHFNETMQKFYEEVIKDSDSYYHPKKENIPCTLEEFFNKVHPVHMDLYLTNGRFFERKY